MRYFKIVDDKYRKFPNRQIIKPKRGSKKACAYDFYSNEYKILGPGESYLFMTDICVVMPDDECLELNTRSGNGVKSRIRLSNSIGWIDADFIDGITGGNIGICLENNGPNSFVVQIKDRIAQGKFSLYKITDDDETNDQRIDGFGSSGK